MVTIHQFTEALHFNSNPPPPPRCNLLDLVIPTFLMVSVTASGYPSYCSTNDQSHEAGYDAFITGSCFATMANHLGTLVDPPQGRVSPTCNLIAPFHNK